MSLTLPALRSVAHASAMGGAGASPALYIAASRLGRTIPYPQNRRVFSTCFRQKAPAAVIVPPMIRPRRMPQRYPHNSKSNGLVVYQQQMPKNLVLRSYKGGRYGWAGQSLQSKRLGLWGAIAGLITACFGNSSDPEASSGAMIPLHEDAEDSLLGAMVRHVIEKVMTEICEIIAEEICRVVRDFIANGFEREERDYSFSFEYYNDRLEPPANDD